MPDILTESTNLCDKPEFANLTAHEIFHEAAVKDAARLTQNFSSLLGKSDADKDSRLAKYELRHVAFSNNVPREEADAARFMIRNFSNLDGLGAKFNTPANGALGAIGATDIMAFESLSNPQKRAEYLREYRADAQASRNLYAPALLGGLSGLALSGCALVAAKPRIPGKLRAFLMTGALAAVPVGILLGNKIAEEDFESNLESSIQEKMRRVSEIQADREYLSAAVLRDKVMNQRLDRLASGLRRFGEQDTDSNGYLDRTEISLAAKTTAQDVYFNKFLNQNYVDLRMVSAEFGESAGKGVSLKVLHALTDEAKRNEFFAEQRAKADHLQEKSLTRGIHYAAGGAGLGLTGALLTHSLCPTKYKPLGYLASGIVGLGTLVGVPLQTRNVINANNRFIENQKDALNRVLQNI